MNDVKPPTQNKPQNADIRRAPDSSRPRSKKSKGLLIKLFVGLIIVALAATAGYLYWQNRELRSNPGAAETAKVEKLTEQVGKLMALPDKETPTVATVEDKSKLKDQPFFEKSENGDKILIYTEAKKAIIYRPAENRIINVGPIAITDQGVAEPKPEDK